ncbi:hypothetical protein BDR03DRAFT_946182 [Suillus americanus]|nr:hypothetical protein BDR03DRAFT_946182 [Suillus americanus]
MTGFHACMYQRIVQLLKSLRWRHKPTENITHPTSVIQMLGRNTASRQSEGANAFEDTYIGC